MEEYRKVLPLKMPDEQERNMALGSLIGEKYTLKKTFQALQNSNIFQQQDQQGQGEWMYENEVDGQTYGHYTSSFINYLSEERKTIYILKINCCISQEEFKEVKKSIKVFFQGAKIKHLKQKWKLDESNMGEFYSEKYGEKLYDSQKILRQMQQNIPKDAYCMLALTDFFFYNLPNEKSLFSCPIKMMDQQKQNPDDWWIFGLASVKDRVGVVNYKRFVQPITSYPDLEQTNEKTNKSLKKKKNNDQEIQQSQILKENEKQQQENNVYENWKDIPLEKQKEICRFDEQEVLCNLIKVVNHEISHMFGIRHCIYYKCVMNGSSYKKHKFDDFKNKAFDLCLVCLRKLQYNMGFDIQERYQKLSQICGEMGESFLKYSQEFTILNGQIEANLKFAKSQNQNNNQNYSKRCNGKQNKNEKSVK